MRKGGAIFVYRAPEPTPLSWVLNSIRTRRQRTARDGMPFLRRLQNHKEAMC